MDIQFYSNQVPVSGLPFLLLSLLLLLLLLPRISLCNFVFVLQKVAFVNILPTNICVLFLLQKKN
jgi:hypothetical protein